MRFTGSVASLSPGDRDALFDRSTSSDAAVRASVGSIISRVRTRGDDALRELGAEFDGVELGALEVPRERCGQALRALDPVLRGALERAARNIEAVHRASLPRATEVSPEPGITVGRRPDPLGRVGVYAPGGRAAYPSSVLMGAIPARVAGVGEVILCSPPVSSSGLPSEVVLAAAALAGIDRVFALGGAGAVAAMAFGTATVPRVDRLVGPGNAYVAEAKLQVAGAVAIDAPAGPSEILVVADSAADPAVIARELAGQAEHDPLACAVVVIYPAAADVMAAVDACADRVIEAITSELAVQPRREIVRSALARAGGVVTAPSRDEAVDFANRYAAEHVLVLASDSDSVLLRLRNAGTVFLGPTSSNAFGDYMTGANHVLPTGGLARSYSGLSVQDFFRWTTWQRVDADAARRMAEDTGVLADAEGLPGHAAAARAWSGAGAGA